MRARRRHQRAVWNVLLFFIDIFETKFAVKMPLWAKGPNEKKNYIIAARARVTDSGPVVRTIWFIVHLSIIHFEESERASEWEAKMKKSILEKRCRLCTGCGARALCECDNRNSLIFRWQVPTDGNHFRRLGATNTLAHISHICIFRQIHDWHCVMCIFPNIWRSILAKL